MEKALVKDGVKVKAVVMEKEKRNGNMAYAEIVLLVASVSSLTCSYYLPVISNLFL